MESIKKTNKSLQLEQLLTAINELCIHAKIQPDHCIPESWPSTRALAEYCGLDIYKTRYLLLKLVDQGVLQATRSPVSNSLHWQIIESVSSE